MKAIIGLGSNLGDRATNLRAGLSALAGLGAVTASPCVVESADESRLGPDYLNTVALLDAQLEDPPRLLEALLRIELSLGRDRGLGRNAPRTLDLDLIATEGGAGHWRWPAPTDLQSLGAELSLELPHPRALRRNFVLDPLRALAASGPGLAWCQPLLGRSVQV